MAATKGNQFWKLRSSHGKSPKFETSDLLWSACCEYFEWVEANPLMTSELVKYQGEAKVVEVPKMRAMTIAGLCLFLDISTDTWANYRSMEREGQDYVGVTTRVDAIIYEQKFTGAAADLLNPNIIARDLGLAEKKDVQHGGTAVTPVNVTFVGVKSDADTD